MIAYFQISLKTFLNEAAFMPTLIKSQYFFNKKANNFLTGWPV